MDSPSQDHPESHPESPVFEPAGLGPAKLNSSMMEDLDAWTGEVEQVPEHIQAQEQCQAPEQYQKNDERISNSIKSLRNIEKSARAEMELWEPCHLRQPDAGKGSGLFTGNKRKASSMENELEEDDTDSDSDGDDEDKVAPHDPNQQLRPKLPIYHPGFNLTQDISQKVLKVFTAYITTALNEGYQDAEADRLRNVILSGTKIKYHDTVKLAVAGDTGVGKSALLNAILGVINLNIESDAGGACTYVITEFRQCTVGQTTAYAAEVEFFDLKVCVKLVTDLFRNWFTVKEKKEASPDDVDDEDLDKMNTARDCIQQMFADRLGQGDAESFMATATSADDVKVLNQLVVWTTDMRGTFLGESDTSVCFGSDGPEKLIEQYHPFTRESPHASFNGKPLKFTPWPLVRIVRVSLDSPILKQNVIVADVPGVSDINYFRVENAGRYLQECDRTMVVGKIDRLQDNSTFQHQYLEAFRRKRSGSVILIATRSDDLNEDNYSNSASTTAVLEQLVAVDQKVKMLQEEITRIDNNMREKIPKADKKRMREEKKRLISRKNAVAKKRKEILIDSRNKQVRSVISGNYRTNTDDDAGAEVYCVSNRMYMRHLRGYDKSDEHSVPTMTLEQTQIPALCSHIYSLPSKGRAASLNHFVRISTPTLLNIIQMSCSTTTLARANHLVEIVRNTRKALCNRINKLTKRFCETEIKRLEDCLADRSLQKKFDTHAFKSLASWEHLKAASHRAAVNKKGNYVQKKMGINLTWNEDLLAPVRPSIDLAFQAIIDESVKNFDAEAAQASREALRELDEILKNDTKALASDAYRSSFKDSLSHFNESISFDVSKAAKTLKEDLMQVNVRATLVREEDYFTEAMNEVYMGVNKLNTPSKGVTMFDKRKEYLKEAIPGPTGPFSFISKRVSEDSKIAIRNASGQLSKDLDAMLFRIQGAFERMKKNKENDTPQGIQFRKDLDLLVAEARKIMDGVARESLDLCMQYK